MSRGWIAQARLKLEDIADVTMDLGHTAYSTVRAHRVRFIAGGISVLLAVVGVVLLTSGSPKHRVPPPSPRAAASPSPSPSHRGTSKPVARVGQRSVGPSRAANIAAFMHISIPSINVVAGVMQLGLNPDHTVEVPPLSAVGEAGWYRYSPLPGDAGPSVILGHINSAQYGPGVFVRLSTMHTGDLITIVRADHRTAVFRADRIAEYPKSQFPSQAVYGHTDGAKIRLVTCGGKFDPSAGSYLDNIVVYGTLVSLRPT
ncbi:MAG: class F sortase [Pseudonocardiales bacterium]|nr:MAG: class F sortase [Pseudonocardiales bacterium]